MTPRRLLSILLALNALLIGAGALLAPGEARSTSGRVRVGLVFDVGGKNDKSFNEAAWRGLERARAELGVEVEYIEPTRGRRSRERAARARGARRSTS